MCWEQILDVTPMMCSVFVAVNRCSDDGLSLKGWVGDGSGKLHLRVFRAEHVSVRRDGLEDPLDDAGLVQQQLDQLSTIGRCEYEKTCALLVQLFDQAAQTYQELLQSTNSSAMDITVQEGKSASPTPVLFWGLRESDASSASLQVGSRGWFT